MMGAVTGSVGHPAEGDLAGRGAHRARDVADGVEGVPVLLLAGEQPQRPVVERVVRAHPGTARRLRVLLVLAGEEAAGQRRPGQQPDVVVQRGGDDLVLVLAADEAVLLLQGDRELQPHCCGGGQGELQLPAGEVGQPDVVDLAGVDGVVEEAEGLLDRGQRVPPVHLVEVDVVPAEATQRGGEDGGSVLRLRWGCPEASSASGFTAGPGLRRRPALGAVPFSAVTIRWVFWLSNSGWPLQRRLRRAIGEGLLRPVELCRSSVSWECGLQSAPHAGDAGVDVMAAIPDLLQHFAGRKRHL
jgi:hypothetical protein